MQHKCNIKCPRQPRLATWTRNRPSLTPSQTPIYICTFALWMLKTAVRIRHLYTQSSDNKNNKTNIMLYYNIKYNLTPLLLPIHVNCPPDDNENARTVPALLDQISVTETGCYCRSYIYIYIYIAWTWRMAKVSHLRQPKQTANGSWPDRGVEATVSAVSALDHFATTTTTKKGRNLLRDYEWMIFA